MLFIVVAIGVGGYLSFGVETRVEGLTIDGKELELDDTVKVMTYYSSDSAKVQSIKSVWKLDTLFVEDTITGDIYPVPKETGEILFYDTLGTLIRKQQLKFSLPLNWIEIQ